MGNDGGSIPDRRDLVKTKAKAEQADKANQTRARWFYCALSKRPLQEPIVSCALGKLYNKDAILEYLLDKSAYGDGEEICGHIKSLKDVKALKLTPNSAPSTPSDTATNASTDRAQFVCPLTLKEMNGVVPFVYIATCGCVLSHAGLKALAGSSGSATPPSDGSDKDRETKEKEKQLDLCPSCATKYDRRGDVRMLNPDAETEEAMYAAMEERRGRAKASKASKKRKAPPVAEASGSPPVEDVKDKKAAKKAKTASTPLPTLNPSIVAASRAVASSLAMEEAKRKANMSDAVKSLYESNNVKETFMTRGTFTRVSGCLSLVSRFDLY
ncbi:DUF602-domain-containing protein [Phellopilus nigrolimitatus]|nr:DUF602-domain-containing protein [Phellopilus nigrolimitatus]